MNKELLLKVDDVHVHYGGVRALDGASIAVDEGEIVVLMGPMIKIILLFLRCLRRGYNRLIFSFQGKLISEIRQV